MLTAQVLVVLSFVLLSSCGAVPNEPLEFESTIFLGNEPLGRIVVSDDGKQLFVREPYSILQMGRDGSCAERVYQDDYSQTIGAWLGDIAVTPNALYFSDWSIDKARVGRIATTTASTAVILATNQRFPSLVATSQHAYWASGGTLFRVAHNSLQPKLVLELKDRREGIWGSRIQLAGQDLLWAIDNEVWRVRIGGTAIRKLAVFPGVVRDAIGGPEHVVYASTDKVIWRASTASEPDDELTEMYRTSNQLTYLASDDHRLYWLEWLTDAEYATVGSLSHTDGDVHWLTPQMDRLSDLAVDTSYLYVSGGELEKPSGAQTSGFVHRIARPIP